MTTARRPLSEAQRLLLDAVLDSGPAGRRAFEAWQGQLDLQVIDDPSRRILAGVRPHLGDDELGKQVRHVLRFTWVQSQMLMQAASRAIVGLDGAGIPSMGIKGVAVLHHTGWDMSRRPMGDVDLAVPIDRLVAATDVLADAGFTSGLTDVLRRWPEHTTASIHALAVKDRRGAEIDLHWSMFKGNARPDGATPFWDRSVAGTINGASTRVLDREDTVLQVIANRTDPPDQSAMQWITDLVGLLETGAVDWNEVGCRARPYRLSRAVAEALPVIHAFRPALAPATLRTRTRLRDRVPAPPMPRGLAEPVLMAARATPQSQRIRIGDVLRAERRRRRELIAAPHAWATGLHLGQRVAVVPDDLGRSSPYLLQGWHLAEAQGMWTRSSEASFALPLAEPTDDAIEVVFGGQPFLSPGATERRIEVFVDDDRVASQTFRGEELRVERITCAVPARPRRTDVRGFIRVRWPVSPSSVGYNGDPRPLGLMMNFIELRPPSFAAP